MCKVFLTAEWRKLAIANYIVEPEILKKYIPFKTELDLFNGSCFVSLVGFMFLNVKVKDISIPFHKNFEEVNLRFYVKYKDELSGEIKRGVVFIKEIVPKPAIKIVANTVYGENYDSMEMKHEWKIFPDTLNVSYSWKNRKWNSIGISSDIRDSPIRAGSEEEFITEHYWGYTKISENKTSEYQVEHPRWNVYSVLNYKIDIDFNEIYGNEFSFLQNEKPASVFLAEGSEIKVYKGRAISN